MNAGRLVQILGPLEGARIPGGCDRCDAYQTVEPIQRNMWRITVHHDADCKRLRRLKDAA